MASPDLTAVLARVRQGDRDAVEELVTALYPQLRWRAAQFLCRERRGHTLQPTALVNEAYLRLFHADGLESNDRAHFQAGMAQQMRRILVDYARSQRAEGSGRSVARRVRRGGRVRICSTARSAGCRSSRDSGRGGRVLHTPFALRLTSQQKSRGVLLTLYHAGVPTDAARQRRPPALRLASRRLRKRALDGLFGQTLYRLWTDQHRNNDIGTRRAGLVPGMRG